MFRDKVFVFALFCVGASIVSAFLLQEAFGTHRPFIHLASLVLTATYAVLSKREGNENPLRDLGIRWPRNSKFMWWLVVFGILSGVARFVSYRSTGLGGAALYERELVHLLGGESPQEIILRYILFGIVLYLAVLIPGTLFCGIIQGTFHRRGLFLWGLLAQSLTFGLVHAYMLGTWSFLYGLEAFSGALIYGLAYRHLDNIFTPALFMSIHVWVVTVLLRT